MNLLSGILTPMRLVSGLNAALRSWVRSKTSVTGPGSSWVNRDSGTVTLTFTVELIDVKEVLTFPKKSLLFLHV